MIPTIETVLVACGLKFKTLIAASLGALVSVRLVPSETNKPIDRLMTWLCGTILGAYLSVPAGIYFETGDNIEGAWALIIAIFGMTLSAKMIEMLRDKSWIDILAKVMDLLKVKTGVK